VNSWLAWLWMSHLQTPTGSRRGHRLFDHDPLENPRWRAFFCLRRIDPAWLYYGSEPLREWLRTLRNVPAMLWLFEPRLYQTHSLRTFWSMLIPWPSTSSPSTSSAQLLVSALMACWLAQPRSHYPLRYSALLLATVLLAPHLTVYDLVILAPAFLLLGLDRLNPDHFLASSAASSSFSISPSYFRCSARWHAGRTSSSPSP
jgi:hypothetical protein